MSTHEASSLSPVLEIYQQDEKFVQLLELFRRNVPDIQAIDFFEPNSRLRNCSPDSVTNLHMFALLSFHFLRFPPVNKRSGCHFVGKLKNTKKSGNGVYFSRPHIISICNLLLRNGVDDSESLVNDTQLKKIWDNLVKLSKSSSGLQNATFDIPSSALTKSHAEVTSNTQIGELSLQRGSEPLKRSPAPLAAADINFKRNKPSKVNKQTQYNAPSVPNSNYKYINRSTTYRQAVRNKALRAQNQSLQKELSDNKSKLLDMIILQKDHSLLKEKFDQTSANLETICKSNKDLSEQLKSCKNEIEYLTNKLFIMEELQSELNAIENILDDPNFEIDLDSEVEKANDEFNAGKEFPQIKVRLSLKKINPRIHMGCAIIRRIGKVSLENCMPLFLALANSVFEQNWNLGNQKAKARQRHALPPTSESTDKTPRKPINEYTLPTKSFTINLEKNVLQPAALRSSAVAIKDCDVGSLIYDHMSINRQKAITLGVTSGNVDQVTEEKKSKHMTLAVKQVVDTTASGTFRSVIEILRLAAAVSADSNSAEDVQKSFKQILSKLKFQVTDDASQMRPVCEKLNELIILLGIDGRMIYIHCNAHIAPALDLGVTKVLIYVEKFLQISDQMVRSFNQSFHRTSNSTILTMVRAIFQFIGDSCKNQAWAMTSDFQTYLDIIAEDGEKNFFKNPDSSKFGLCQEMCFILMYSFDNVRDFIERVYAGNTMYKSCSLYINCPFFKECLLSITLFFYHITSPFLVAVGAETQYGYCNLSHSELLDFFPKFVDCLQTLTDDPSPYLSPERIGFLNEIQKITTISKKKYREMFATIFERISSVECDINLEIVKTILKLLSEEYLIVIDRQAKEFYIGEDCVVAKQLASNPEIIDLVATTSLSAEHSVGITRQDFRRAPCALMSTLSANQTFRSSPFGQEILNGKMTPQKLDSIMKETRKSGAVKLTKQLTANDAAVLKSEKQAHFAKLEADKKKIVQKKLDIAAAVKGHGGPLQTPQDVDEICKKYHNEPEVLKKIVATELSYQKVVICNNTVPDTRYREINIILSHNK